MHPYPAIEGMYNVTIHITVVLGADLGSNPAHVNLLFTPVSVCPTSGVIEVHDVK